MSRAPFLPALILGVSTLGCAALVTGVTAYAPPQPSPLRRYALEGPDPRQPGGDPRWPARAVMVERALASRGFQRDETAPEFILHVSYGSGDTRTVYHSTRTKHGSSTTRMDFTSVFLRLEALDPASVAAGRPTVLWSTLGEARPSATDLDEAFPYLLASMAPAFGTSVPRRVDTSLKLKDPEVLRLMAP